MKINLAENMLRFGVKNLNETATSKVKTLAEQQPAAAKKPTAATAVEKPVAPTPVQPGILKTYKNVPIDEQSLFWTDGVRKSTATINVTPSSDNKYYIISEVILTPAEGGTQYTLKFQTPLTFVMGANSSTINKWRPLITKTLQAADATTLQTYMNFPGGSTKTRGGNAIGSTINNPDMVAFPLATSIYDGIFQKKLVN